MVGCGNPLFYQKKDSIPASVLADYPMVVHPNLHSGPFSDIFSRLGPKKTKIVLLLGPVLLFMILLNIQMLIMCLLI